MSEVDSPQKLRGYHRQSNMHFLLLLIFMSCIYSTSEIKIPALLCQLEDLHRMAQNLLLRIVCFSRAAGWDCSEGHGGAQHTTSPWGRVLVWWLGSQQWLVCASLARLTVEQAHHMRDAIYTGGLYVGAETAKRSARTPAPLDAVSCLTRHRSELALAGGGGVGGCASQYGGREHWQ